MKFTAAGDAIIQKKIPNGDIGVAQIAPFINRGDVKFFNLETNLFEPGECYASQFSGGTYIRTSPKRLADLMQYGFNMTSFNNNHCMDFSYDGLLKTYDAVEKSGLVHAGVGYSLKEASSPKYLQTPGGTVALIAFSSSFESCAIAGDEAECIKSRPGVNGLRLDKYITVPENMFDTLKILADESNVNLDEKISVKEGYCLPSPDNVVKMEGLKFVKGDKPEYVVKIIEKDLIRAKNAIKEALFHADEVIVSIHSHQLSGDGKECVPQFLEDFAHMCIDEGATAIIGHGPHLLRGIEVYKECPIFYSLGDFILQLYDVEYAPADFYEKYGLTPDAGIETLLKTRSKNYTIGLMEERVMFQTVIPYWEHENGKLKCLELLPVELVMQKGETQGLPRIAEDHGFMERLAELSKPYGVTMTNEKDVYQVHWQTNERE